MFFRERKNLQEDITELADQLAESSKAISDVEKMKRAIEVERNEVLATLEETEATVETEEARCVRVAMELNQLKSDAERKMSEKDEEIDTMRRNGVRAVETNQASVRKRFSKLFYKKIKNFTQFSKNVFPFKCPPMHFIFDMVKCTVKFPMAIFITLPKIKCVDGHFI